MSAEESMVQEALAAINNHERARARDLLTRLLKINSQNADYWLWMSAVVDSAKERTYCLKEVLRVDPNNLAARRGLMALGALPPDPELAIPLAHQKRNWQSSKSKEMEATAPRTPWKSIAIYGGAAVVILVLIGVAIAGVKNARARNVVGAPISYQPVPEITATPSPAPTATPLPVGPTPPWAALAQTYTPTPVYVNTPHPRAEAFAIAMRAYQSGDWEKALTYLKQAAAGDPTAPDIPYRTGDVYTFLGDPEKALDSYEQSIKIDENFAPAYLGRAKALRLTNPDDNDQPKADLEKALALDPNLAEAHLVLADIYLNWEQPEAAMEQLDQAEELLAGSPFVPYYRAQVYLQQADLDAALQSVDQALSADLSLLPAYRLKAKILQASGDAPASLEPLKIYEQYGDANDAETQTLLAVAYASHGYHGEAIEAFSRAIELDRTHLDTFQQRGDLYLTLNEGEKALSDFNHILALKPRSFEANLGKGRAYLLIEQYGKAYEQFNRTEAYAETDPQKAQVYYWRALSLEPGNPPVALLDWQALMELPEDAVPSDLRQQAALHIADLVTATPAPTQTSTPTQNRLTATASARTKTPAPTPTAR